MIDAPPPALVLRETALSAAINMALSGLFFLLVFGTPDDIATRSLAIDFLPQGLAIGFMGSLVPGLIVRRRVMRGLLTGVPGKTGLSLLARSALAALAASLVLGGCAAALLVRLSGETRAFVPALAIKLLFGAVAASAVTPGAVRAALRRPVEGAAA